MLKNAQKDFIQRHIGPSKEEQKVMLKELGYNNLDELIDKFKSDDEYNVHIQREAVTYILRAKRGSQRLTAKERLISIIISNRY